MDVVVVIFIGIGVVIALFLLTAFVGAPYVPSHRKQVRRSFRELRPLTEVDGVVDLGAGDGRVLQEAVRAGAGTVTGVEINPLLWGVARLRARKNARIVWGSMWRYRLPESTTVVYVFGVGRDSAKLVRYMQRESVRLKKPLEVITYGNPLAGQKAVGLLGAHFLYRFTPSRTKAVTV